MDAPSKKKPAELSIGRNMLWNSAGSLTYLALQWAITIVIVRLSSGYDAAGVLALAMTVFNVSYNHLCRRVRRMLGLCGADLPKQHLRCHPSLCTF